MHVFLYKISKQLIQNGPSSTRKEKGLTFGWSKDRFWCTRL